MENLRAVDHKTRTIRGMSKPMFADGSTVLWRSKSEVQFGFDYRTAVRLSADDASFLISACTGTLSVAEILHQAESAGRDITLLAQVIARMLEVGLLIPSNEVKPEQPIANIEVEITGAGRLGTTVAILLAHSGLVNIRIKDRQPISNSDLTAWGPSRIDIGQRRDHTALLILERIQRGMWPRLLRPIKPELPKLAIRCPDPIGLTPWLDPNLADDLVATDTPHIVASTGATHSLVSTVLNPKDTACLRCFHARLADLDSAWPLISSQLIGRPTRDLASAKLVLQTAIHISDLVIDWCSKNMEWKSGFYELAEPMFEPKFLPVATHSSCGCQWNKAS